MERTVWDMPSGHRIDPPDEVQIRLLMNVSPAQRIRNQLGVQALLLRTWRMRLRRANPDLTDLDLTRLVFERLKHNG